MSVCVMNPLYCHATTNRSGPFQGLEGQPRETTHHQLGPIRVTFGLLKFQKHYVSPFYLLADRPNCAQCNSLKCAHITLLA